MLILSRALGACPTPPGINHEAEPEATTSESSPELQEGPTEGQASSLVVPEAAQS